MIKYKKNKIYKKLSLLLVLILVTSNVSMLFANSNTTIEEKKIEEPQIEGQAAILINPDTREVIYSKNADEKMFPASTTKMITALLSAEDMKLEQEIQAPPDFKTPDLEGTHIAIDQSEKFTMEQLLNALLIASANDAAEVLAIADSGSIEAFMDKVNKRLDSIGAKSTHFTNPHGLHNSQHYTTARDLSTIAIEFMKNPIVRDIIVKKEYTIPPTNKKKEARNYIKSTNWFINDNGNQILFRDEEIRVEDENVIGVKTGYTDEAGFCLVSEIEKDNKRFIAVVLKSPTRKSLYQDSKKLLYYGIEDFKTYKIVAADEKVTSIPVEGIKNGELDLLSSDRISKTMNINFKTEDVNLEIKIVEDIPREIQNNQVLGEAIYTYKGEELGRVKLLAAHSVGKSDFLGDVTIALSSQAKYGIYVKSLIVLLKLIVAFFMWKLYLFIKHNIYRRKTRENILKNIRKQSK